MTRCVLAMLLLLISNVPVQRRPDLSGSWVPIPSEFKLTKQLKAPDPDAPPAPPAPPEGPPSLPSIRITHNEPDILLEYVGSDGATISSERRTTDNAQNINQRAGGALTQRSRTRWENGALRTESRLMNGDATILSAVEHWQVSPDGATLTVSSAVEDSKSRSQVVTVYRRRP
jgi:hypothetical protein